MRRIVIHLLVVLAFACAVHLVHAQPEPVELELKSYWPGVAGGTVDYVEVTGNLALVSDRHTGVQVLDVSDLANPVLVGRYDIASPLAP